MIHVFFVPGMFGSTIEYVVRSYSNELTPVDGKILADGSMHSFSKSAHFIDIERISDFFESNRVVEVTTPIYPFKQQHLPEILEYFNKYNIANNPCILIHATDVKAAELNMLFQYHKVSVGLELGLDIFCNSNEHNITAWNPNYTHWSQMHTWQLREWISLFYVPWCQEWIESSKCVDGRFLTVKNTDFLFDTVTTANKIFGHCKLTQKSGLDDFLLGWQKAQQYIVDEFMLLDRVVECSISNQPLEWEPINIIAEAIVQQRFRAKGYEIRCDGLDKFPTDAIMFNTLLEKVHQ
jgi:hypothetical protein